MPPNVHAVDEVRFPVLTFPFAGSSVVRFDRAGELRVATKSQLRRGFFTPPFRVISIDLVEYCSHETPKVLRGVGGLFGYNLFLNRNVEISIPLNAVTSVSLAEASRRVAEALRNDPTDLWVGGEDAPEEIALRAEAARTTDELFNLLA
jgi:hypothetical protein